jgi:hypothetical protein
MIDATPRQKIFDENRRTDNHTTRKFLTNSHKSIFNLKWEVGGVAEKNYQRSRSHSQHEKRNHYKKRPTHHNESMPIHNSGTSYQISPKPNVHYYPYVDPQNRIKQSEKPRNPNELRIEHHYVDSPSEAKKLIDDLRRKGFVETGIATPGVYPNHKKK